MHEGQVFDRVAAAYDAQRSGYPRDLFADIMTIARLRRGDHVLEVGCGSGQATAGFAAEGLQVIGVDPGAALIELAERKFSDTNAVRFQVAAFEEWPLDGRKFHLVAAAQSWHWLQEGLAFKKAADALVPDGCLSIFGHTPAWSTELIERLRPVYAQLAPELWGPPPEAWYLPEGPLPALFTASGCFERPERRSYRWRRTYDSGSFAAYLGTRSDHLRLPQGRRNELLQSVQVALPDLVEADWVTNLYVARAK